VAHRSWFLVLVALTGGVIAGVVFASAAMAGASGYGFLLWNLVLAWVPVGLAMLIFRLGESRLALPALAALLVLWVLFLPNAPYLVTDLIHLGEHSLPLILDGLLLLIAAATGVLAGLVSLALVELAVRIRFGVRAARLSVAVAIPLASAGVYFGRVLRWNSWDALVEPWALIAKTLDGLADPFMHTRALMFIAGFAIFLGVSYALYQRLSGSLGSEVSGGS